jgi:serine/threonine protein kinase
MFTFSCFKRKLLSCKIHWKKESQTHKNVEAFLRNNGPLAIRRYSYSDIKNMTNLFRNKLGEGGFGGVYEWKLQDGCLVAVKVLKESRGNGEDFINEVASISRTSHVNIVTLMGFCFEGSKRALIYEFMPNGSLEKFIYKENPSKADCRLEWETTHKIALGIARGLEYLHRGCNTRILHFDIKPHNILLDENFCPKISDFGLAKICAKEESIISMLGARGTIGYVAPELICRNFGRVSHKSDVYSYGMMVSEMAGGRKNIDIGVDRTSELFFPHWIYKRLELDEELGLHGLINEKDKESAKKMIIVSLWCI